MRCMNCNWCWQDSEDEYPRCHWEYSNETPCEEDTYDSDYAYDYNYNFVHDV